METNTTAIELLQRRLERLERQNRRMKSVGLLIVAAVAIPLLLGAYAAPADPDVIRAKKFVLVGEKDKDRGVWEERNGTVSITFLSGGTMRSEWSADGQGAAFSLITAGGYPRLHLTANKNDATFLSMGPHGQSATAYKEHEVIETAKKSGVVNWTYLGAGSDARLIVESQPDRRIDLWSGRLGVEAPSLTMKSANEKRSLVLGQNPKSPYQLTFCENDLKVYQIPK